MTTRDCTYVTSTWGVHDERWAEALHSCGFAVVTVSLERDQISIDEVRAQLETSSHPVLAGPLLTVTKGLLGISAPLYGLSWGFDLIQADSSKDDLSWLQQLPGLIVDSEHTASIALRSGMEMSRIHRIPWGVDLETFTPYGPTTTPAELGMSPDSRIVLSLRGLEPLYRVEDIIRAFAEVADDFPDVHLVIGNDGSLRPELKNLAESLQVKDRMTFIGRLGEDQLPPLLRAAATYVTASEVDGSSVTLLQAMGCGTPVVASNTPGNREWVEADLTGELFRVGDSTDLARALRRLLSGDRGQRGERMRRAAREAVENRADWARNSRALERIIGA